MISGLWLDAGRLIRRIGAEQDAWPSLNPPYATIVADPPWPTGAGSNHHNRSARPGQEQRPYSTMALDEIAGLPVSLLACDVATCFLWTIDKYLYDAPAVLRAWGFQYHLTMSWDKANGMSMYGFTRQTEFVVVGFKGPHDAYPEGPTIRSSFTAKARGHSTKPPAFFDMVEATCLGPYVELFARQPRLGWDAWGKGYESSGGEQPE